MGGWNVSGISIFPVMKCCTRQADEVWSALGKEDFWRLLRIILRSVHPKSIFANFSTASWSSGEQAGVSQASEDVLDRLVHGNKAYLDRFGYIFIVCATERVKRNGGLLEQRLPNEPDVELRIAAQEQAKITHSFGEN